MFLAHCTDQIRNSILDAILNAYPNALDDIDLSKDLLSTQLNAIRKMGFFCDQMPHKAHSSLAAPIYDEAGVKAVLDIRFPISALSVTDAVDKYSKDVMTCAQAISTKLQ